MTIQFLILKNLPRMEKTRMTEIHSQDTLHFIRTHRREDVRLLALQAHRYPSVDMPAAITQISGWQIAREKIRLFIFLLPESYLRGTPANTLRDCPAQFSRLRVEPHFRLP